MRRSQYLANFVSIRFFVKDESPIVAKTQSFQACPPNGL